MREVRGEGEMVVKERGGIVGEYFCKYENQIRTTK
jgi:hypothetical protein